MCAVWRYVSVARVTTEVPVFPPVFPRAAACQKSNEGRRGGVEGRWGKRVVQVYVCGGPPERRSLSSGFLPSMLS